jgi:hypothetical protein
MGAETLDQYGLRLSGYAEAGLTYNFVRPGSGTNGSGFLFNDKSDDSQPSACTSWIRFQGKESCALEVLRGTL